MVGLRAPISAVLCSQNPHKLEELRRILPDWSFELLGVADYPPEDGASYEENARAKAHFGRATAAGEALVLGEDSGIEVAALRGAPGIESARWADDGVERLLVELEGVTDRRARYVCTMVGIASDGAETIARGSLEGRIATARSGSEGFGYDPVFVPEGEERTVAELGDAWKAKHSHRALAAQALDAALPVGAA